MLEDYATSVYDELKTQYGIDIDFDALLELLIEALEFCIPFIQELLDIINAPTRLQKAALGVLIRRRLNVFGLANVKAIRDTILAVGKDKVDEKGDDYAKGVLYEVRTIFHPYLK